MWRNLLHTFEMNMLDSLKQAFTPFDEVFQKAKLDNSKLLREADGWLLSMRVMLEESVMGSLQNQIPYSILDQEELDKNLIVADALISKIGSKNTYASLQGLETKYNDIRAEFTPSFEDRILKCFKLITHQRHEKKDHFTILSDSFDKSNPNSNSNFLDELY